MVMLQLASEKCYPLCIWSSLYYDCDRDRDKCGPPCIIITIQLVIDKSDFYFMIIIQLVYITIIMQLDMSIVFLEEDFFRFYILVSNFEKYISYFVVYK